MLARKFAFLLVFFCVQCQAQPLRVVLDWFVNPNHAAIVVAKAHGFFEREGLEVEIITPADPSDPPKLVAAGKADIAVSYPRALDSAQAQKIPLKQVGVLIDQPLSCLVVLIDSNIHRLKDLRGKKIGYASAVSDLPLLHQMLKHAGMEPKDVTEVNVHYGLTQALLSHKVDAVMGMMRNYELIQLEQEGRPGYAFFPEHYGVEPYPELILVAHKDKAPMPVIEKFLAALKLSAQHIVRQPNLAWREFILEYPETDNDLNLDAWYATVRLLPIH